MACTDFLIWVGQTYEKVESYIFEAAKQGCCRRIQRFPLEAVPGLSRVFLVHKDDQEKCIHGSLFGFYYVDRIEIITTSEVFDSLQSIRDKWADDFFRKFSNPFEEYRNDYNKGSKKDKENFEKKIKRKQSETLRMSYIRKAAQGEFSGSKPAGGDAYDKIMKDLFSEILEELFDYLLDKLESGDSQFVTGAELQGGAGCSKRNTTGAVYLVDSLYREISNEFQAEFQSKLKNLSEKERINFIIEQKKSEDPSIYPEEGVELWRKCQKKILTNRKSHTEIIRKLDGKAEITTGKLYWDKDNSRFYKEKTGNEEEVEFEGELIVFKNPYPLYEHLPRADFRGYRRIDGAYLLQQVIDGIQKPLIPYCPTCLKRVNNFSFSDAPSKSEIIQALEQELLVDKNHSEKFINNIKPIHLKALKKCDISFYSILEKYVNS